MQGFTVISCRTDYISVPLYQEIIYIARQSPMVGRPGHKTRSPMAVDGH
jgi:hypothetical protein